MTHQINTPDVESEGLSSVPEPHMVEERTNYHKLSSDLHTMPSSHIE
jgi:hypothetical protein